MAIKDGMIRIDSEAAIELGFSSTYFYRDSYLWKDGNYIYISLVTSIYKGQGFLSTLFDHIFNKGYSIKVPSPLGIMPEILMEKGFSKMEEQTLNGMACEVWVKENKKGLD